MKHFQGTNRKVALYCHVRSHLSPWEKERELFRQQQRLEQYALEHELSPSACFLHLNDSPKDPDFHRMVLSAVRHEFYAILLENFSRFPHALAQSLPKLRLFSVDEKMERTIGRD